MQKYPHNGVGDTTARYADDVNDLKPHLNTANHALIAAAVDNRRLGSSSATALSHAPGVKPSFDDDSNTLFSLFLCVLTTNKYMYSNLDLDLES